MKPTIADLVNYLCQFPVTNEVVLTYEDASATPHENFITVEAFFDNWHGGNHEQDHTS